MYIHLNIGGVPQMKVTKDALFHGKSHLEMDDLGVPYIRKPPYIIHIYILTIHIYSHNI